MRFAAMRRTLTKCAGYHRFRGSDHLVANHEFNLVAHLRMSLACILLFRYDHADYPNHIRVTDP